MRTRAAVLRKAGTPWEITELELDPPKANEVLIQMEAAGLCHSDEHIRARGTARLPMVGEDFGGMCVVGSFAEYAVLSEWSCVKIEDDIPFELAALVSCGVTTGFCSATKAGDVRPGDTVVIFGTGGVGMNAVQGAWYAGG